MRINGKSLLVIIGLCVLFLILVNVISVQAYTVSKTVRLFTDQWLFGARYYDLKMIVNYVHIPHGLGYYKITDVKIEIYSWVFGLFPPGENVCMTSGVDLYLDDDPYEEDFYMKIGPGPYITKSSVSFTGLWATKIRFEYTGNGIFFLFGNIYNPYAVAAAKGWIEYDADDLKWSTS